MVPVLFTFYIQSVLKLEENNSGSERLIVKRKTFPLLQLFIEYFKHGIYSPFFPLQDAVCFVILTYLVAVLFTFYIQGVLKLEENNSDAKRLIVKRKTFPLQARGARRVPGS